MDAMTGNSTTSRCHRRRHFHAVHLTKTLFSSSPCTISNSSVKHLKNPTKIMQNYKPFNIVPIIKLVLIGSCLQLCSRFPTVSSFLSTKPYPPFVMQRKNDRQTYHFKSNGFCKPKPKASFYVQATEEGNFPEVDNMETLQTIFSKHCGTEGLMTKSDCLSVPAIAELMRDGDLLDEEFNEIWENAPKFPDDSQRVDVDSFVQIYRDIDDLFEEEGDSEESSVESPKKNELIQAIDDATENSDNDDMEEGIEAELETIFRSICDKDGLASKEDLRTKWEELDKLIAEGLLGEDEFDSLWGQTKRSPGSSDKIDVEGFLSFGVALDGLFVFDDDDLTDEDGNYFPNDEESSLSRDTSDLVMVEGDDLTPSELFSALCNEQGLICEEDLKRWRELQDMLAEGDLLESEVEGIYNQVEKSEGNCLDEGGFLVFYKLIDELFEYDGEDEKSPADSQSHTLKRELLDLLDEMNSDDERLSCGLESEEWEQRRVLNLVEELENSSANLVRQRKGAISTSDLAGKWELLYTSSGAVKFNKGLSGLGGSFPNGKFGGLKQTLRDSKYLADVEYLEHIDVNPSSASFDVKVTGTWELRSSVSIFTGEPSIVLTIDPGMVKYGPTSTRADHWKSLGPMNMLDVIYLDDNLRIMRGNTSIETVFIFRRI